MDSTIQRHITPDKFLYAVLHPFFLGKPAPYHLSYHIASVYLFILAR